ncbi:MAG TPA: replication factor C large subunit, partial [Methanomassiliicoccales archaeon]|nr:replication factor C large subunit [Methanomassiliicoccales archaeon]
LKDWAIQWESARPAKPVAVLIGPPGVGKTSAALALAHEFGWGLVEMNASDHRNGEAIRRIALRGALADTFTDSGDYLSSKEGRKKLIVLDEADNIFGREDQGGVSAIAELVHSTRQPVILIVNDFYALSRKSSVIKSHTLQIKFTKIQAVTVRGVLRRVAKEQGIAVGDRVLELISKNSNGDLRAALRDLQALGLGATTVREDQPDMLDNRLTSKSNYDLMAEILHGTSPSRARTMMQNMNDDPETLIMWVDENVPVVYRDPEDLSRSYQMLTRADMFLGRVRSRNYYGFWSYATDLTSYGICAAKQRQYHEFARLQFPLILSKLSRSKFMRNTRRSVGLKLGATCHISSAQAVSDILPYFAALYKQDREFRLAATIEMDFDEEEAAFVLDEKVDSSTVKHLFQDVLRKLKGEEKDEHDLVPTKIDEVEAPRPEPGNDEDQTQQKSLFEF